MNNGGDVLARGARRATFPPAKVSQDKWDAIWADEAKEIPGLEAAQIPTAPFVETLIGRRKKTKGK
jgi:hypothetical protein